MPRSLLPRARSEEARRLKAFESEWCTQSQGAAKCLFFGRGNFDPLAPTKRGSRSSIGWRGAYYEKHRGDTRVRVKGCGKRFHTILEAVEHIIKYQSETAVTEETVVLAPLASNNKKMQRLSQLEEQYSTQRLGPVKGLFLGRGNFDPLAATNRGKPNKTGWRGAYFEKHHGQPRVRVKDCGSRFHTVLEAAEHIIRSRPIDDVDDVGDHAADETSPSSGRNHLRTIHHPDRAQADDNLRDASEGGTTAFSTTSQRALPSTICDLCKSSKEEVGGVSDADLTSCATCIGCGEPWIPHTVLQATKAAASIYGDRPQEYEFGRMLPRPHGGQFLKRLDPQMYTLLEQRHGSCLMTHELVARAGHLDGLRGPPPILLQCQQLGCEHQPFYFDFVYDAFLRVKSEHGRTKGFYTAEMIEVVDVIAPRVRAELSTHTRRRVEPFPWTCCINCATAKLMGPGPPLPSSTGPTAITANAVHQLGAPLVLQAEDLPKLHLRTGPICWTGFTPIVGVTMVDRAEAKKLIGMERSVTFKGEVGAHIGSLVGFGSLSSAQHAAGGGESALCVNAALLLLVDPEPLGQILRTTISERSALLLEMLRADDHMGWAEIAIIAKVSTNLLAPSPPPPSPLSCQIGQFECEERDFFNGMGLVWAERRSTPAHGIQLSGCESLRDALDGGERTFTAEELARHGVPPICKNSFILSSKTGAFYVPYSQMSEGFEQEMEHESLKDSPIKGDSEAGRCCKFESLAGLPANIHFATFATMATLGAERRGTEHTNHLMVAMRTDGDRAHLLMIYAGGPNAQRSPMQHQGQSRFDAKSNRSCDRHLVSMASSRLLGFGAGVDEAYAAKEDRPLSAYCGEPRTFLLTPGRNFRQASRPQNKLLHARAGAVMHQENAMGKAALESLLLAAALNLVPKPTVSPARLDDVHCEQPTPVPGQQIRSHPPPTTHHPSPTIHHPPSAEGSPIGLRVPRLRKMRKLYPQSSPYVAVPRSDPILGKGASRTAAFTWDVARQCDSQHDLILAISAIKGYYRNMYPGGWHKDSDDFMETWVVMQSQAAAEHSRKLGVLRPAPTLCPQLGIYVEPDPNVMVVTALFQRVWHCTGKAPRAEGMTPLTSRERASLARGAGDSFFLQSRGRRECFLVPLGAESR